MTFDEMNAVSPRPTNHASSDGALRATAGIKNALNAGLRQRSSMARSWMPRHLTCCWRAICPVRAGAVFRKGSTRIMATSFGMSQRVRRCHQETLDAGADERAHDPEGRAADSAWGATTVFAWNRMAINAKS